jgi:hypothetical protein
MRSVAILNLALTTLLLTACGGGGDDGEPAALAPSVSITASNQGAVARAAVDGGQAIGAAQVFQASDRATALAARPTPTALRLGAMQGVVRKGLEAAFAPQRTAAIARAVQRAGVSSSTEACAAGGSITTSENDADNSMSLTAGDGLSITFNQCKETAGDMLSGALVFYVASVTSTASNNLQFGGTLEFQAITAVSGQNTATIHGNVSVSIASTSTSFQMTLGIGANGLTVGSTAPGYSDSIVYDPGMQLAVTQNEGTTPSSVVTLNGMFSASSIGGRVMVTTLQPVTQYSGDDHPSSGQLLVTGASGTHLRITALSNTQAQLDLDANGDGTYEQSAVVTWLSLGST